jgi:predicted NBD/HSP70 family sugar kinase
MLSQHSIQLPQDLAEAERQLSSLAKKIISGHKDLSFQGLGVSIPGRVNADTGILEFTPNLPWKSWDIGAYLSAETGLPVEMQNAADAIVLFERWSGAFREIRDALVITISEGVGVGILCGGRQLLGSQGMAGEFGHVVLDPNGLPCGCGKKGCWEMLASNRAIEMYAASRKQSSPRRATTYGEILQAAENAEPEALRLIEMQYRQIGDGLRLVLPFVPEVILFAGDFVSLWERFSPAIESSIRDHAMPNHIPKLLTTGYGSAARLKGAVALILQRIYRGGVRAAARSVPAR